MSIKKWFEQRSKPKAPRQISVDDLIILERYEEAERMLKDRLRGRGSRDLQSMLKLAELYERTSRPKEATEEYLMVADRYMADGFFDKAAALLSKATKLAPMETKLHAKLARVERMRKSEQRLSSVMRALSSHEGQVGTSATTSYLELRRVWGELAVSDLMDRLDNEQLGRLLKVMELVRLGRRHVMAEKGEQREELYLVTRGKVEAIIELPNGETTVLRTLEPGDVMGERALLEHKPWPATYQTSELVVVLKLDRSGLEAALHGNPDPRQLLNALREQRLDVEVASAVEKTLRT